MHIGRTEENDLRLASIENFYNSHMERFFGLSEPYISSSLLYKTQNKAKKRCLQEFDNIPKIGRTVLWTNYREKLENKLVLASHYFYLRNKSKNVFG